MERNDDLDDEDSEEEDQGLMGHGLRVPGTMTMVRMMKMKTKKRSVWTKKPRLQPLPGYNYPPFPTSQASTGSQQSDSPPSAIKEPEDKEALSPAGQQSFTSPNGFSEWGYDESFKQRGGAIWAEEGDGGKARGNHQGTLQSFMNWTMILREKNFWTSCLSLCKNEEPQAQPADLHHKRCLHSPHTIYEVPVPIRVPLPRATTASAPPPAPISREAQRKPRLLCSWSPAHGPGPGAATAAAGSGCHSGAPQGEAGAQRRRNTGRSREKMMRLAEEQQRLMQQALQQNLLAMASHFKPMNLKLNNGQENKQDMSFSISTNGSASISVSVEVNGTVYSGTLYAQKASAPPMASQSVTAAGTSGFSALSSNLSPSSSSSPSSSKGPN
ncbi:hypothetical protein WMY93_031766 [Mugilogobius chulae]|uniref:REKLES domain-containing protein n=1 Tax=Mugilogobius chulae TaxID=88201 RepID=A0AAW0MDN1_9GOBI